MGKLQGYYSFDLIQDNDKNFKIIDSHGLADVVSFTERAGYVPRFDRIYRYMDLLGRIRGKEEQVLWLYSTRVNGGECEFPHELEKFFQELPLGVAHLEWREKSREETRRVLSSPPGRKGVLFTELEYLQKAARVVNVPFSFGSLVGYDGNNAGVFYKKINLKEDTKTPTFVPFDKIGLMLLWGHDLGIHPEVGSYWLNEKRGGNLPPLINPLSISYALNSSACFPRWIFRLILEKGLSQDEISNFLPREIYVGMGLSSSQQIREFANTLKKDGIVALGKPLAAHRGKVVGYFTQQDLSDLVHEEKKIDGMIPHIREKIFSVDFEGIRVDEESGENSIVPFWRKVDGNHIFPVTELGAYALQEFIYAKPVLSRKTGQVHQGIIRAQILRDNMISVMHRFPKEPYLGKFIPLTGGANTFCERADDDLECRVQSFLTPILEKFESTVSTLDIRQIDNLRLEAISRHYTS